MRIEEIRQARRAQPFRPFTLHLADGRQFVVDHPEFILVSRDNRTVVVDDLEGNTELIDSMLVTSLTFAAAEPQSHAGPGSTP
jgi:hypothetical protein